MEKRRTSCKILTEMLRKRETTDRWNDKNRSDVIVCEMQTVAASDTGSNKADIEEIRRWTVKYRKQGEIQHGAESVPKETVYESERAGDERVRDFLSAVLSKTRSGAGNSSFEWKQEMQYERANERQWSFNTTECNGVWANFTWYTV